MITGYQCAYCRHRNINIHENCKCCGKASPFLELRKELRQKESEFKTLRDVFAMSAMGSILVNAGRNGFHFNDLDKVATKAYETADAMLKARNL